MEHNTSYKKQKESNMYIISSNTENKNYCSLPYIYIYVYICYVCVCVCMDE